MNRAAAFSGICICFERFGDEKPAFYYTDPSLFVRFCRPSATTFAGTACSSPNPEFATLVESCTSGCACCCSWKSIGAHSSSRAIAKKGNESSRLFCPLDYSSPFLYVESDLLSPKLAFSVLASLLSLVARV